MNGISRRRVVTGIGGFAIGRFADAGAQATPESSSASPVATVQPVGYVSLRLRPTGPLPLVEPERENEQGNADHELDDQRGLALEHIAAAVTLTIALRAGDDGRRTPRTGSGMISSTKG